jgi:serine/threonine-protein kinase RsbW
VLPGSILSLLWFYGMALGSLLLWTAVFQRRSIKLRVPARHESVRSLWTGLHRLMSNAQLGEQTALHCHLALDEACANIIEHAYANTAGGEIELAVQVSPSRCIITLTDHGESFDPSQIASPQLGQSLENMQPGGLGLHFIRSLMDEVRYSSDPDGNHLTMVKYHPA